MNPSSGFIVDDEVAGQRLDNILPQVFPDVSRSVWQKRIKAGEVLINGQSTTSDQKVRSGDPITVADLPAKAPAIPLPVLFEDDNVVAFDKPVGVLTHSKGSFNPEFTVADHMRIHFYADDTTDRPGIVHRLDRGTSGVIICAKNEKAQKYLQKQFAARKVKKNYLAIVQGRISEPKLIMNWPIGRNPKRPQSFRVHINGKVAVTELEVIDTRKSMSLVRLQPQTGRTHQLRVHLKHLGNPIVGDELYGGLTASRMMLHAQELQIKLPTGQSATIESDLPADFKEFWESHAD